MRVAGSEVNADGDLLNDLQATWFDIDRLTGTRHTPVRAHSVDPLLVDPDAQLRRVEANELANLEKGNPPFRHQSPDKARRDAERCRHAVDVE